MARKDPQEKKALSYARDRRNDYGEHDKGSRGSIRRNKRIPHRADRRREHRVLTAATGRGATADASESTELRLLAGLSAWRRRRWRKCPDVPLGTVVADRLRRRAACGMDEPAAVEAKIARIGSVAGGSRHRPVPGPRPGAHLSL